MTVVFTALVIFTFPGCVADDNTTTTSVTTDTQETTTSYTISLPKISVVRGSHLMVTGVTNLPDGTELRSQLFYQGAFPFAWWPKDQDIEVVGGQWELIVPLGINGAPEELPQETLVISVWSKTNPGIKVFDIYGLFLPVN